MNTTSTARRLRLRRGIVFSLVASLALTGCAAQAAPKPTSKPESKPSEAFSQPKAGVPTVPGYDQGEFPPVPLFLLPDLSLLDSSASAFTIDLDEALADIPGVTASPAHCDEAGAVVSDNGSAYLYGDGSGNYTGPDGSVQNFGDGSGSTTINGVTIQNFGDGSGTYDDGTVSIQNFGDGAGNYTDPDKTVEIFGDGSGNYTEGDVAIQNFGDGAGSYSDGKVSIQNFGDGSGNYTDGTITIQNHGDGTAVVNGKTVEAEPLPPVPPLGSFPPLAALAPLKSCGTTLTFHDGVLFDFDRSNIRADAAETLDAVAKALTTLAVAHAEVSGHTDAIGSDSYNQELSEARAAAVVSGLEERGVTTSLTAQGFGETRPVAPNEVDGADNPAGRQLNRRVELFIPSA